MDTLTPLEATRRAYRLVGGVLVERTVGEVLPTVKSNQEGIKQLLLQLAASKTDKEKAAAEWKVSLGGFGDFPAIDSLCFFSMI